MADISFIEDLSHTLRFAYYRGANGHELIEKGYVTSRNGLMRGVSNDSRYATDPFYLTDKDSVIEVNFDHKYKIYENLTAVVELGYLHRHADKDVGKHQTLSERSDKNDDAWKAQVNLQYSF